jgi:hypothetical protein
MILLLAAAECGVGSYFEDVADRMILFPTEGSLFSLQACAQTGIDARWISSLPENWGLMIE